MNNAKIWLVVKPTVGIPLFLSAVAIGSFAVHVAVLSNTSWVSDFLSGKELGSGMAQAPVAPNKDVMPATAHVQKTAGGQEIIIVLPDGSQARAVLEEPATLAALKSDPPIEPGH